MQKTQAQFPDLKGKRILITGASSGIGAGMALALARAGSRLVLHYNRNEIGIEKTYQTVTELGAEAQLLQCDFKNLTTIPAFFDQAWQVFEGLDGLVNNAGIITKSLSLKDKTGQQFNNTIAVNLQAPYLLSTHFADACKTAQQEGVIVNNSSVHGQATCEWFAAYAASKAGLDAMMKVHAVEWGQYGIRVNSLAPGVVPVERTFDVLYEPAMEKKWVGAMPAGRYGSVEDMGATTAFLLSDVSEWMTGSVLTMDGGLIARGHYPYRD
ncbi:SDR family NAD(P)-dependent oxidoreductase [Hydrogenovibrio sp. 3SP14C1]|uniref:SDR family NAD(P)-dependent oxidoreductase n=1 Tax=Hydrogenovibrio sp. 3SP14C1 TaxID=3038774 RepID=UPI00241680EE|nr:SDR family oxidoreductase [Hydrogenovibrio sp. 3SP14C1]MDG4811806.1 SDR family NAD(P)-dependent oxidoreductase [Hydrogenovibrio sp. 3SP14C1]